MKPTWLKKPKCKIDLVGRLTMWVGKDADGVDQTVVIVTSSKPMKLKADKKKG